MYMNGQGAPMMKRDVLALGILGAAVLFVQSGQAVAAEDRSPEAVGSALLDKYVAAVNAHDTSSFADIHTESYIQHSGQSANGLTAQIENFRAIFSRMPDVQARVDDRIIAGDQGVARMTFPATHTPP